MIAQGLELSRDQQRALTAATELQSGILMITGKAGTGKSVVTREIRNSRRCLVAAPTGLAGINVGAPTIHSLFGISPKRPLSSQVYPRRDKERLFDLASKIIFDEVSMIRSDMFDTIDHILRVTLNDNRPFGGKPIIVVGDPWQLEPVVKGDELDRESLRGYRSPWFFDSKAWNECSPDVIELGEVFRQAAGPFTDCLNTIRTGDVSNLKTINDRHFPQPSNTITLCTTNAKADEINRIALNNLEGEARTYAARHDGFNPNEFPVEELLTVKVGCRVMIVANDRLAGHVNGDFGQIVGLGDHYIDVRLDRNEDVVRLDRYTWEKTKYSVGDQGTLVEGNANSFTQFPVKLGYSVTVHKAQGQTLERAHVHLERSDLQHGLTYVALSRVKSLRGLTIERPIYPSDINVSPRVRDWADAQRLANLFAGDFE